jgi:hypothetical protein
MIEEITIQLSEKDQIREARKVRRRESRERRKLNRTKTKRHCCKLCGQTKQYICLEHHPQRKPFYIKLPKKIRYYFRKFYFAFARKVGFIN